MYNHCCQNTTNTTNATGGLISQIIGGICGCKPRCETVTFPVYATVTVPVTMLQGGTTGQGQTGTGNGTTGQGQNGCCCNPCNPCHHYNPCNPCGFGRCGNGYGYGNNGYNGFGRQGGCGRGVAASIVTGGTVGTDETQMNRYGYYPYGYYPCGNQGGCCGR